MYLILEARQRYADHKAVGLWDLIHRVYNVHTDLMTAVSLPEVTFFAHITVAAWQKYATHMRERSLGTIEDSEWIRQLCHNFSMPLIESSVAVEKATQSCNSEDVQFLPMNFDFDMIDWSSWEALLQGPSEGFVG